MIKTLATLTIGLSAAILAPASISVADVPEPTTENGLTPLQSNSSASYVRGGGGGVDIVAPVEAPDVEVENLMHMVNVEVIKEPEPEPVRVQPSVPEVSSADNEDDTQVTTEAQSTSAPKTQEAPPSSNGSAIVATAMKYIGTPYVAGGKSPSGFDCSGFTSYVFGQHGTNIPSSSSAQRHVGTVVSNPQPGDLIWSPGHVGIYVGNGQQIDAPRPGKTIQVRGIWQTNPTYIRVG